MKKIYCSICGKLIDFSKDKIVMRGTYHAHTECDDKLMKENPESRKK